MKKKKYDLVYFTNSPTFYKINLLNEIAKERTLFVFFLGYTKGVVNVDFKDNPQYLFDYTFLYNDFLIERNRFKVLFKLIIEYFKIRSRKVIYTGWYLPEYMLLSFFIARNKNCMQCESTIFASETSGIKGVIKSLIIKRMSTVLPSGVPHREIFDKVNYQGKIILTGGVGIFNKNIRISASKQNEKNKKYLYIGRLSQEKNLEFLIKAFNENEKLLTIVGQGDLEDKLKAMAKSNICFAGFIENQKLVDVFREHDIFILPSAREPWGLVVDEAIYNGLPVIVSNKVGAGIDMVQLPQTGCIFENNSESSLNMALNEIERNYFFYKNNVDNFDFELRDKQQIDAYVDLI